MSQIKVLVIDDDLAMRGSLELAFLMENFSVVTAESGMDAVKLVERERFDVAFTDLRMPGMSGLETLTALKKLDPALPVVVISAYISGGTAAECMRHGAFEFLRKPFELKEILSVTRRAVDRQHDCSSER